MSEEYWQDNLITDMETSHIINTMKMLERELWGKIGVGWDNDETRKMVGAAIGQTDVYIALEAELLKRLKAKKVRLKDFFLGCKRTGVLRLESK